MRLLLVEDTLDVAEAIVAGFERRGDAIDLVETVEDARDALAAEDYDAVILDINLPDGCGTDVLRELRRHGNTTPVLVLTARFEVEDRVAALDIGADDYLVKPFDLRELEARARALIRRAQGEACGAVQIGTLRFDPAAKTVVAGDVEISLTRRELRLLEILITNRKRILSTSEIHSKLFSFDDETGFNAVELYIARLRRKIIGCGVAIRNQRGIGYQLSVDD